ncbi:extensin family protein [Novispirillum sp. DQ9]|uniref:extensin family protein n=1 Tax=Novispirillum sp. DQ9 TaxID=3398612 RepID=UPI003C7E2C72
MNPLRLLSILALAATLAACAAGPPAPSGPRSSGRVALPEGGAACVVQLNYHAAAFDRVKDTGTGDGCGVVTAVALVETATPLNRPVTVDCGLALKVAEWDRDVLRPLAREVFGKDLKTVHHYGGYVCRGRTSNSGRLSEHAYGRAIDIGAFELEDGTVISVKNHWSNAGNRSTFLRRAAQGACGLFSVVLTPASDRAHADHFHLDVGPWKLCST